MSYRDLQQETLFASAAAEAERFGGIRLQLDVDYAMILVSMLQLALRHPHVPKASRVRTLDLCCELIERFPPAMQQICRQGFDSQYDVSPE